MGLADNHPVGETGQAASQLLSELDDDARDYAISSAYALLIDANRRKELSAYFTPPTLAAAAMRAASPFLEKTNSPSVLDPACGGGSFLVPTARRLISTGIARGLPARQACADALSRMCGIELDPALAALSAKLLANMLAREHAFADRRIADVLRVGDALSEELKGRFDVVVGNPPYGRIGGRVSASILARAGRAKLGGHTNIYSLFLLRALDWVKPGGGLVFVLPTSFVAGPYFSGLRQEILQRANVIRIDLHEQRDNLFVDAVQDVCLLTLQRHGEDDRSNMAASISYELGVIDFFGACKLIGSAQALGAGEPWMLPVPGYSSSQRSQCATHRDSQVFVISAYGYQIRVGKVVPTRERQRLKKKKGRYSLPLIWASDVRSDGSFAFGNGQRLGNAPWYNPPSKAAVPYATRRPAVAVQRTSNRDQRRRLNAASVPSKFRKEHSERGFVAENHVIIIEATKAKPVVSPQTLAAVLNSAVVSQRFSAVSGSFSVSAKLLKRLALPDPRSLPDLGAGNFQMLLQDAFREVRDILGPLETTGDLKDCANEAGDLARAAPVDKDTGLQRRAVA